MTCDSCDALVINGVPCHETGCPESHIDLRTGRPYLKECSECGCEFEPESKFQRMCDDCNQAPEWGLEEGETNEEEEED